MAAYHRSRIKAGIISNKQGQQSKAENCPNRIEPERIFLFYEKPSRASPFLHAVLHCGRNHGVFSAWVPAAFPASGQVRKLVPCRHRSQKQVSVFSVPVCFLWGSEGVYGLQRAFKMAGVKYIIMSLWQVPDKETVEFMEMFYKKLLKTKDVRRSFNETQKEMRKKFDPYYWGAFVLVE